MTAVKHMLTEEERARLAHAIKHGHAIGLSIITPQVIKLSADKPSPPERVWECPHPDYDAVFPDCGLRCSSVRNDYGKPPSWHRTCWSAYQIKTLREMIAKLRDLIHRLPDSAMGERYPVWGEVVKQLAELYPERKDAP